MIRVSVHLISAIDGSVKELARMDICNVGGNHARRDYEGRTYKGRDREKLDKGTVSKYGKITGWRSEAFHIWNLVRAMLDEMRYDEGRKK